MDNEWKDVGKRIKENKKSRDAIVGRGKKLKKVESMDKVKTFDDKEERNLGKKRRKVDIFAGYEDDEVRGEKNKKRDHMLSIGDKDRNVEKKKKRKKERQIDSVSYILERRVGKEKGKRADMKAHNKDDEVRKEKENKEELLYEEVNLSDDSKVFRPCDTSNNTNENDGELVQGKRFSKEEDEMIREAVSEYVEAKQLGEEGINMVLQCRHYPELKGCWNVIRAKLPWRPKLSVYLRAHILFERGESKWTPEEVEALKIAHEKHTSKFHHKHTSNWRKIADELGKHRVHVFNAWHRFKLVNLKKGKWSQDEYATLFELVNADLQMRVFKDKKSRHGMLRDNISWQAISDALGTRTQLTCCKKWYRQLTSPMVAEGEWADVDDHKLLMVLVDLDASCEEEVDWDNLLEHRSADVCRKRWQQMIRHLGEHGNKSFSEQVEVLSRRYCPDLVEARETFDAKEYAD